MSGRDLAARLKDAMPQLRGRLTGQASIAEFTWFRVGGPAEVLFVPADEDDLAHFLTNVPADVPVTVIGLASNLIVRDGGVPGIVIRLTRGFSGISVESGHRVRAGSGAPDVKVARAAADAGIAGLSFLRGIPGSIGGALRMNGGAYGTETKDVLIEARAITRSGGRLTLSNADMGYSYRHCSAPDDLIFVEALFQGRPGGPDEIKAEMDAITQARSDTQPVNERTGGSTFKNPPGQKAWQLIDAAGCRGQRLGGAQVSEKHCNFLINTGNASAYDIESLGESVRERVKASSGVMLEWEIKRIGVPAPPAVSN